MTEEWKRTASHKGLLQKPTANITLDSEKLCAPPEQELSARGGNRRLGQGGKGERNSIAEAAS